MRPTDLAHLAVPGDPQLHPDGRTVVYVLTELDLDDDRSLRTIHRVDAQGTRRFTHGPSDTSPRWSPDGRWLAFLRTSPEEGQRPQLHVMPSDGGEAQRRTDLPLGVTELAWAPDSTRLVVLAAAWDPDLADLDDDERARRPKRITRLPYRTDRDGWIHGRRQRLYLVDVEEGPANRGGDGNAADRGGDGNAADRGGDGAAGAGDDNGRDPTVLDTGERDASAPVWRPDGAAIAYLADPDEHPDTEPHNQAFELDLTTGARTALCLPGMWSAVHYDPDGRVHLTGLRSPFDWPGTPAVWRRGEDGALHALTEHLDRDVLPASPGCTSVGPRFVDGGFLVAAEGRGTTGILTVRPPEDAVLVDGILPEVVEVVGGHRCVTGFSVSSDGGTLAMTVTDPATPGELVLVNLRRPAGAPSGPTAGAPSGPDAAPRERCVTDLAPGLRARIDLRPTQRFSFERDGVDLDVWAVLPPGFDDAEPGSVPVLFHIHGGPTAQYGDYFFDEFQVAAGAGYLAIGANPRGSSGRGRDFARAVVGAWVEEGSVDTLDLEAVVDAALARFPAADPDRVGIMGGSYGGYATARLLARTDRYGSAVVERGLLQWESFSGTSDIGSYFDRIFLGTSLVGGAGPHHAASPVRTAHRITTPTLILHSEADWRCPIEQAEQLFVALRHAGVPCEMLRFPNESHELSRSGAPKHRIERFEAILDWHARHLDVEVAD